MTCPGVLDFSPAPLALFLAARILHPDSVFCNLSVARLIQHMAAQAEATLARVEDHGFRTSPLYM